MVTALYIVSARSYDPFMINRYYTVTIKETVTQDFQIKAISKSEALEIARKKYCGGEIVLEPGELISVKFKAARARKP